MHRRDEYPPLTRCWNDLERRFVRDPAFDDGVFVQGWIRMDFPFGPSRQTALDYFEEFLAGTEAGPQLQPFIDDARRTRLGLHQDVMRTEKVAKFRELLSGTVTERSHPSSSTARVRSCSSAPATCVSFRNAIERAAALASETIEIEHLALGEVPSSAQTTAASPRPLPTEREAERQRIVDALAQCAGNQTRAASVLGISRRTLVSRLTEHGIARPLRSRED